MNNFRIGQLYYDDKNGRYLTIIHVNENSKTVYCYVYEYNDEQEDFEYSEDGLFTYAEMKHFEDRNIL